MDKNIKSSEKFVSILANWHWQRRYEEQGHFIRLLDLLESLIRNRRIQRAGRGVSQMAGSHRTHTGIEKGNDAIDRLEGTQTGRHAHGTEAKQ